MWLRARKCATQEKPHYSLKCSKKENWNDEWEDYVAVGRQRFTVRESSSG